MELWCTPAAWLRAGLHHQHQCRARTHQMCRQLWLLCLGAAPYEGCVGVHIGLDAA